jgi:hypothetical protein
MLSDDDGRAVVRAALRAAGDAGQSEEEVFQLLTWANETRVNEAMLQLVLAGEAAAFICDGELMFKRPP